jgi:hypothetical protein
LTNDVEDNFIYRMIFEYVIIIHFDCQTLGNAEIDEVGGVAKQPEKC